VESDSGFDGAKGDQENETYFKIVSVGPRFSVWRHCERSEAIQEYTKTVERCLIRLVFFAKEFVCNECVKGKR
jgi:hypothetical protein